MIESIHDLMQHSGVAFGTSGARGLESAMTDAVCYAYTRGFLRYLRAIGEFSAGNQVGLGGDLRASTPRILAACAQAVCDLNSKPVNLGLLPTPALAVWSLVQRAPALMVTGSHIPDDRNGIKFYRARGEILKADEAAICTQPVEFPNDGYSTAPLPPVNNSAAVAYVRRYLEFFPSQCLAGLRLGLYEHSSVAREAFYAILTGFGAQVIRLGRANDFVPVDTEALRPEDVVLAQQLAASGEFDALISSDGDGDRPLLADEQGIWMRGDLLGLFAAHFLRAQAVVTPVTSNTALERSAWFTRVERTRIGSPFVIERLQQIQAAGIGPAVGYEANGGFLLGDDLRQNARVLSALPTRDAILPILAVLLLARKHHCPLSQLTQRLNLPARFTASERIPQLPTAISQANLAVLAAHNGRAVSMLFGNLCGSLARIDTTDGLRLLFANDEILHLRPSGNAPELRLYAEADSPQRVAALTQHCIDLLADWRTCAQPCFSLA